MDASHARPMTAYAALCAVAVVVLAQGVTAPEVPGVSDPLARAGEPALLFAPLYTLSAEGLGEIGGDVGRVVVRSVVAPVAPVVAAVAPGVERVATASDARRDKRRAPAAPAATTSAADTVVVESGRSGVLERSRVLSPAGRAEAKEDRKADRAAASSHRKADRVAAKADRKSERAAAKAQRQAARAKHRR